jgi:hypothetical protein
MIYKIHANELFTDDGAFIKKLKCPSGVQWDNLAIDEAHESRQCASCDKRIYDTGQMTDEYVLNAVKNDPRICLKIDFNQENIKVVSIYEE